MTNDLVDEIKKVRESNSDTPWLIQELKKVSNLLTVKVTRDRDRTKNPSPTLEDFDWDSEFLDFFRDCKRGPVLTPLSTAGEAVAYKIMQVQFFILAMFNFVDMIQSGVLKLNYKGEDYQFYIKNSEGIPYQLAINPICAHYPEVCFTFTLGAIGGNPDNKYRSNIYITITDFAYSKSTESTYANLDILLKVTSHGNKLDGSTVSYSAPVTSYLKLDELNKSWFLKYIKDYTIDI